MNMESNVLHFCEVPIGAFWGEGGYQWNLYVKFFTSKNQQLHTSK